MAVKRLLVLSVVFLVNCSGPSEKKSYPLYSVPIDTQGFALDRSSESLYKEAEASFKQFDNYLDKVLAVEKKPTIENTFEAYNDFEFLADSTYNNVQVLQTVAPEEEIREKARKLKLEIESYLTRKINLNPNLYKALSSVKLKSADTVTKYYAKKVLRDFRRSGVAKSESVRKKIANLEDQLSSLSQNFQKNISDDVRKLEVKDSNWLKGMPQDYIDNHKPNEQGVIVLTTDYPDVIPLLEFAENIELKRQMHMLFLSRGYPKNVEVLNDILKTRYELAKLLGYSNHAYYKLEPYMVNSPAKAHQLIERVIAASTAPAKKEFQEIMEIKKKSDPKATGIFPYEYNYLLQQLKKEKLNFDPQEIRNYLEFSKVKQAVLDITGRLFGLNYKKVTDVKLWHSDVEAYDVYEGTKLIGRFYLDLFPRDGKFKHAAQFTLRKGQKDKLLPQGVLVCNFPNPNQVNPALLSYDEAETMLHEFGHLIHLIVGSRQHWYDTTGHAVEWDFIETPSQMLEEWFWDMPTLSGFAKHYKTGEPVPQDLVEKLKISKDFGKGLATRRQMIFASYSLDLFNRNPEHVKPDQMYENAQKRLSHFKFVPDTHFTYSFGHLIEYSAAYYTYIWSQIIAKDFYSEFEKKGLFDAKTAQRYREQVLEKGGSIPAEQMVRGFLGRPMSYKPFTDWLAK